MSLEKVQRIDLPKIPDDRGNLSFIEQLHHVPFEIKRLYWIYDVPGGEVREGHAFKTEEEFIIALSGSFDLILSDGTEQKVLQLNRSYYGYYIPAGIWRELKNFSTNSVVLVLSSLPYNEDEYMRDFEEYKKYKADGR